MSRLSPATACDPSHEPTRTDTTHRTRPTLQVRDGHQLSFGGIEGLSMIAMHGICIDNKSNRLLYHNISVKIILGIC